MTLLMRERQLHVPQVAQVHVKTSLLLISLYQFQHTNPQHIAAADKPLHIHVTHWSEYPHSEVSC